MFLAKVYVALKPTVNDPQGLTVKGGLHTLGFQSVEEVRVGKYLEIRMNAKSAQEAAVLVQDMCRKLLANPVIEHFRFDLEETSPPGPLSASERG